MHPSKRNHQCRSGKKPAQGKHQQRNRRNFSKRPYHLQPEVSQAELDESIELLHEEKVIINLPREHQELLDQHDDLKNKIKSINNRLTFGFSEPLQDYRDELLKQDMQLLAKITDVLVDLKKL